MNIKKKNKQKYLYQTVRQVDLTSSIFRRIENIQLTTNNKSGPNVVCVCGSGKKFKKCCRKLPLPIYFFTDPKTGLPIVEE